MVWFVFGVVWVGSGVVWFSDGVVWFGFGVVWFWFWFAMVWWGLVWFVMFGSVRFGLIWWSLVCRFGSVPFGSARLDSVVWFDSISFFHGHQRSINEARDDQTGPARLLRHTGILPFGCCVGGLSADATLCVSLVRKHQSNIAMAASAFASPNNRPPRASAYSLHSLRTAPQVVAVPLSVVDHLTVDAYDAVRKRKNH